MSASKRTVRRSLGSAGLGTLAFRSHSAPGSKVSGSSSIARAMSRSESLSTFFQSVFDPSRPSPKRILVSFALIIPCPSRTDQPQSLSLAHKHNCNNPVIQNTVSDEPLFGMPWRWRLQHIVRPNILGRDEIDAMFGEIDEPFGLIPFKDYWLNMCTLY